MLSVENVMPPSQLTGSVQSKSTYHICISDEPLELLIGLRIQHQYRSSLISNQAASLSKIKIKNQTASTFGVRRVRHLLEC